MRKVLDFFIENWIRLVASFVFGAAVMVIFVAIKQNWSVVINYVNGLFLAGFLLFAFGVLIILTGFGSFNMFTFYFNRKKKDNGYKENYYEYTQRKEIERSKYKKIFLPYLIIGTLYILISVVLYFICLR